jgi:hypothetical protein
MKKTTAIRLAKYNSLGFLLLGAVLLFCWTGNVYLPRGGKADAGEKAGYSPPLESVPAPSEAAKNNNATAALHIPCDLEGTAVLYPATVNDLVQPNGSFRTDFALGELATIMKIDPQTIARKGSTVEIDPDAVLFGVVTGRLTDTAKAQSRRVREIEVTKGMPPSAVADGWERTKLTFSLNKLIHPTEYEKSVLDAISRSARAIKREPGAKINAVPVSLDRELEQPTFQGGDLPLEESVVGPSV